MKCHVCQGAGFLEDTWIGSGGEKRVLSKCCHCDNDAGYSAEVKRRYSHSYTPPVEEKGQIISANFRRKK